MLRRLRRIAIACAGGLVVTVGVAMLVLPGPAVVVIPAGLAILATEFPWARRLLGRVRDGVARGTGFFKRRPSPSAPPAPPAGPAQDTEGPGDSTRSSEHRAS